MLVLATSALESVQTIPPATWMKLGIGIVALIVAVIVLRTVAKMNKIVLGVLVVVVVSVFFFSWVYNRNEPKWMTPIVEKIAPFFPSAGSYSGKQKG
jgi:MFS superfamily sulfate permease-like transporter